VIEEDEFSVPPVYVWYMPLASRLELLSVLDAHVSKATGVSTEAVPSASRKALAATDK